MIPDYKPDNQIKEVVEIVNALSPDTRDEFMEMCKAIEAGYKQHLVESGQGPKKFAVNQAAELLLALVRIGALDKDA